jgi:hypothetical protein
MMTTTGALCHERPPLMLLPECDASFKWPVREPDPSSIKSAASEGGSRQNITLSDL